MFFSKVAGIGAALPKKSVTNRELEVKLDTTDEWIRSRVGIHSRYIVGEEECPSDLGVSASLKAIKNAGWAVEDVDALIVATSSSEMILPSLAAVIQGKLGIKKGFAFDVNAACAGFVFALSTADSFIKTGQAKKVLVIGCEVMSRIVDWTDRSTAVIFADGCGVLALEATDQESQNGILSTHIFSDGSYKDFLYTTGGPGHPEKKNGCIVMHGAEVMKHAVEKIGFSVVKALEHNNLTHDDIDWFVPHQANKRIIDNLARRFHLPEEKVIVTIDHHGNTSAASIPLAVWEAVEDGRIQKGHKIVIEALGAGFTWGSAVLKW
jgi:3-oxoacyl-[acyl-carrier-protein] synthase-3